MQSALVKSMLYRLFFVPAWVGSFFVVLTLTGFAQPSSSESSRQYPQGSLESIEDLPPSRFRSQIENLPPIARERALGWLRGFHFTELDLENLHTDSSGGIYYADPFELEPITQESEPVTAAAAVPVSPFPNSLVLHSRPGAPNVLYIDFDGENVTGTQWNTDLGRTTIPAVPFNTDSDFTTFSDSEQLAIKRIWQRMAEDYAPFNIDVTTERPATFTTRTAHALITRNTDANGAPNPADSAGGVAYVNVFANSLFARYRPGWVYYNNLSSVESYIAEAASHEIGHNMGLSHDGTTSQAYYGGHGSGDTSWGPLMGTGYNRNVSQWSKGEYYQANNTEDDLAIIAAKTPYLADDHGGTFATARPLVVSNSTNIFCTNPETDPANTNNANKGIIERNTDVDIFSFATGSGTVNIQVNPWVSPSGTKGGNLDIIAELYNQTGTLLLSNNPASTGALVQTNLSEGLYYLKVRNTGVGSPQTASPSGYTAYASIGQYFVSGTVRPSNLIVPPQAVLQVTDITQSGAGQKQFSVTHTDDVAIDVSTISSTDLRVTGPNGYDVLPQLVSIDLPGNGTPRVATYAINPPDSSSWKPADNGAYAVFIRTNEVADTQGARVAPSQLGTFQVNVTTRLYFASMDADPGWSLQGLWQYGTPAYDGGGPVGGITGSRILAYNLSGNYESKLTMQYAITPPINCSGASGLTLRFARWLGLRANGTATIEISTNGTAWTGLWASSAAISDSQWTQVQYVLPSWASGAPALRLRWGIGSSKAPADIGWNIDDVELLAGGLVDAIPANAILSVSDVTSSGSPSHSLAVTYFDDTDIDISSLGTGDILVTGPNGYSNVVSYAGVDEPTDGTPRTGVYSIDAPGGSWGFEDNGTYAVMLQEAQVSDTSGNMAAAGPLGTFNVAAPLPPVLLSVAVSPAGWGTVEPPSGSYASGTNLQLSASPAQYFRFVQWSGNISSTNNPLSITLYSNVSLTANFAEIRTTNYNVPYWWLAANGASGNFETAVLSLGENGIPLWQSYVAGLDPANPASRLLLSIQKVGGAAVLNWQSVSGRVYTVLSAPNPSLGFTALPGASNLPWTVSSITNEVQANSTRFYKLEVQQE